MIPIKPIHYTISSNRITDYFKQNKKDILLAAESFFPFCEKAEISVGYADFYAYIEKEVMTVYHHYILIYRNDFSEGFFSSSFTDAFYQSRGDLENPEELERGIVSILLPCFYLAYELESKQMKAKKEKGTFYTMYKIPKTDILAKRYEAGTNLFAFKQSGDRVSFLNNYGNKKRYTITKRYGIPGRNPVRVFSPETMQNLSDGGELDQILFGIQPKIGYCYQNCENVMKALREAGYDKKHKVEYFAGWIKNCRSDRILHHAWIVVDENSVIDLTIKRSGKMADYVAAVETGKSHPFSRELLAEWTHAESIEEAPFTKYHYYGKVEDSIYVGSACTPEEARNSFGEFPETGKDGEKEKYKNRLQAIYYARYGKEK